ncbi:hypothetical protein BX616_002497 [Lobosporangium transversale]|uniref:Uncharacterized protein n=1 Tax=Lobosporangium transversale TaxID=64571 RepID=A0A1Y2GI71_9FUNG|nr:hypothetical protein BCR41DRAFT_402599 [Lobosporangium transversale]XP_021878330.1 hypothetical protein BCR41DRAFT_399302 [Lobosporangium transversale]KAF9900805.1 hypothetical protein BX616_002497 [Lobosporangium transversale]ORY92388.1 hypothetical protein BCR41DRAFT_402599 [Lobosporangium transversale]ORZ08247.1 hypothetical protein BCR41DRAFT_399302 [Lobosporangium transversale]|eukprot:XP_021875133.1 hypothetical protein BCR41DRAFT_402599 [Lobosporangium transversale]
MSDSLLNDESQKIRTQQLKLEKLHEAMRRYPGSKYFIDYEDWTKEGYFKYRFEFASRNPSAAAKQYNQLMDLFRNSGSTAHLEYASINKMKMTKRWVMDLCSVPADGDQMASDTDTSILSATSAVTASTLSSSTLDAMLEAFNNNYESYEGPSMDLPSGIVFDKAIRDSAIEQINPKRYDIPKWKTDIVLGYETVQSIYEATRNGADIKIASIEGVEEKELIAFNKMIFDFMTSIYNFYEDNGSCFELERSLKNATRTLNDRQSSGHKVDAIFYCKEASLLEIGAVEGGKKDEGSYGTKVLSDGLKTAKSLKDMHDYACTETCLNGIQQQTAREKVEVFGFLVSGLRIQFITLKHFGGRFMYLHRETPQSMPRQLDDKSFRKVKKLLITSLEIREYMRDLVEGLVELIYNLNVRNTDQYKYAQTLTTPPSSPKLKKVRI